MLQWGNLSKEPGFLSGDPWDLEAYSERHQTSNMEYFAKIVHVKSP